ncbi:hypothetical protein BJX64DRAFT_63699 [Aspergillus heterothallicus]
MIMVTPRAHTDASAYLRGLNGSRLLFGLDLPLIFALLEQTQACRCHLARIFSQPHRVRSPARRAATAPRRLKYCTRYL